MAKSIITTRTAPHDTPTSAGGVATLTPIAEVGFNSTVLKIARGPAAEYPWLFVMTLSGIEVRLLYKQ